MYNISFLLEFLLFNCLDDTDCNCLLHVSDGESSEGWVFREYFNGHWLGWDELDHSSISWLDEFWFLFNNFSCSSVILWKNFLEFASNVGCVAIKNWGISVGDLSWVIDDDDLSIEEVAFSCWVILLVWGNVSSL